MLHFFFWGSLSAGQAFIHTGPPNPGGTAIPTQNPATVPLSPCVSAQLPSAGLPEFSTALQNSLASTVPLLFETADSCRHRASAEILMKRELSVVLIFSRLVTWSIEQLPDLLRTTQQLGKKNQNKIWKWWLCSKQASFGVPVRAHNSNTEVIAK